MIHIDHTHTHREPQVRGRRRRGQSAGGAQGGPQARLGPGCGDVGASGDLRAHPFAASLAQPALGASSCATCQGGPYPRDELATSSFHDPPLLARASRVPS